MRAPKFAKGVDPREGFVGLTESDRQNAWLVTDFFDDLGKLLAHKLVRENIVIGTFGTTAISCWKPLGPYVLGQRAINRSSFQIYFEYLVKRIEKNPPERVLKKMNILP